MDLWKELVFLSIDAALFAVTYCKHSFFNKTLLRLKRGEEIGINPNPDGLSAEDKKSIIVKGTVTAFKNYDIQSFYSPKVRGVVQRITVAERYTTTRGIPSEKYIIQELTNAVPFALRDGNYTVEIVDVRDSYSLDLEEIYSKLEPMGLGWLDTFLTSISGVHQRGLETSEEMLKEGIIMNGVGELSVVNGVKTLGPPSDGSAYILTITPISNVIKRFESKQSKIRLLMLLFGTIGLILIALTIKHGYKLLSQKLLEVERKRQMEENRRGRRRAARNPDQQLTERQQCIICHTNPREVVLLPCGHLCLCEDCSADVAGRCPVCREYIRAKNAVFI